MDKTIQEEEITQEETENLSSKKEEIIRVNNPSIKELLTYFNFVAKVNERFFELTNIDEVEEPLSVRATETYCAIMLNFSRGLCSSEGVTLKDGISDLGDFSMHLNNLQIVLREEYAKLIPAQLELFGVDKD